VIAAKPHASVCIVLHGCIDRPAVICTEGVGLQSTCTALIHHWRPSNTTNTYVPVQVVAALAACSLVFAEVDPNFSKTLVDQAAALYVEVSTATNLGRYSNIALTGCRTASDPIDVRMLTFYYDKLPCVLLWPHAPPPHCHLYFCLCPSQYACAAGSACSVPGVHHACGTPACDSHVLTATLCNDGCEYARPQTSIPLCPPLSVALGGSAVELYDSDSFYDDLLWAAAWMYKATGALVSRAYLATRCWNPRA